MPGRILALDADDVLVNMTPKWVAAAMGHPDLREVPAIAAMPREKAALRAAVLGRDNYDLQSWLKMPAHLVPEFYRIYSDDPAFYDDLPPTPLAKGISLAFGIQGSISHVHVLTHIQADGNGAAGDSKLRWLTALLNPRANPVTIHMVHPSQKKSDVMRKHCPEVDSFADDAVKNLVDVLTAKGIKTKELLIPKLGHNSPLPPQILALCKMSNIAVSNYENCHNPIEDIGTWG